MLVRPDFSSERASYTPSKVSTHIKRFPDADGAKLSGRLAGNQITASGTREFLEEISEIIRHDRVLVVDGVLKPNFQHPGSLIVLDFQKRQAYAQTDLTGLFPFFWCVLNGSLSLSDSLSQLHASLGGEVDDVGVAEIISLDYNIGQRTLFKNLHRLRPAESLQFDWDTRQVVLRDTSRLWTEHEPLSRETAVTKGSELLAKACEPMSGTMLMMSAGWDSKTLLAGALAAGVGESVMLYYHGALDSREARIISHQADRFRLNLTMKPLEPSIFETGFLEESFSLYEDVSHPHWHFAGRFAAQPDAGIKSVSAGIFGEIIGGHTGPPVTLKGIRKMASMFGYLSGISLLTRQPGADKNNNPRDAATLLRQWPYSRPWYMKESVWKERFQTIHETVNSDVQLAVERYVERGVTLKESVIEALIAENRFCQIVSDQLRSAAAFRPLLAPFVNRDLLEFSCRIPFENKVHRSLNQRIIKKLFPGLLDFPTAATLCRSKRPILLQEATRAIRRAAEDRKWDVYLKTNGRVNAPNLGWPNFQFLKTSSVLRDMIDGLRSPIWDKDNMRKFIDQYGYRNYHGLQGVMVKVKTLDLFGIS